ncbi:MAG: helix-turn-helix transcriptional regulator [Clostridia bacterium]|nr:helix-turn-helix transcriptional regulator [Clostridia bacterium]
MENRIRTYRKDAGVTQDELAAAVGVTRQTILSLENGKYNASLQLAFRIARYFGKTVEEVFLYKEEEI